MLKRKKKKEKRKIFPQFSSKRQLTEERDQT